MENHITISLYRVSFTILSYAQLFRITGSRL